MRVFPLLLLLIGVKPQQPIINTPYSSGLSLVVLLGVSHVVAVGQCPWHHLDSFHTCMSGSWAGKTQTTKSWNRFGFLDIHVAFSSGLSDSWTSYVEAQGYWGKFQERTSWKSYHLFWQSFASHLAESQRLTQFSEKGS